MRVWKNNPVPTTFISFRRLLSRQPFRIRLCFIPYWHFKASLAQRLVGCVILGNVVASWTNVASTSAGATCVASSEKSWMSVWDFNCERALDGYLDPAHAWLPRNAETNPWIKVGVHIQLAMHYGNFMVSIRATPYTFLTLNYHMWPLLLTWINFNFNMDT